MSLALHSRWFRFIELLETIADSIPSMKLSQPSDNLKTFAL
jgi:hypothetical protein